MKGVLLVQVCYELTHDNREREFSGLNSAIDELNPQKATIVTFNQIDSYIYKGKTVNVVPFYKLYS